jgi:2-oxoglutarate ferredoxin oxidoreductase subunit gamma
MYEIIIAGSGGQGILVTGIILANAGLKAGLHSTWLPSYGAQVRGGTANCAVKVSKNEIGSPYIDNPDILIAFNEPSLNKFEADVKEEGHIFVNDSLVSNREIRSDTTIIRVPVMDLATEVGNARVANIVMLGSLIAKIPIVPESAIRESIAELFGDKGKKIVDLNHIALRKGIEQCTGGVK